MCDPQSNSDALQVLLIADTPEDARLFEELLRDSSQETGIWHEHDLKSGWADIKENGRDVAVVDLDVLNSDGEGMIERLVQAFPTLPIVVLAGQQSEETVLAALEAGATEYLRKAELTPSLLGRTLRWSTERKSMERTLKKREQELQSISENITQGIYRTVPGEGLVYANQAFANLFGYESPEEIQSVDPLKLYVRPERREELREMLLREGSFQNEEVECRRKDGSTFTVLQSGSVVRDEAGEILSYDGAITDITERREAQLKLEESEALTRSVLDTIAANIAVLGPEGTIVDVNEQWRRFAQANGGDPEKLGVGANYFDACARANQEEGSVLPSVQEQIRAVIDGERDLFEYEYPCHSPVEERWFLLRATPLDREEDGAVVAHINITERVQAVREQRVLSQAVDQSEEAILITDAESISEPGPEILYANAAAEEMTGYSKEELLGQTPQLLQGPDTTPAVLQSLREALETEVPWQGETTNYRKDGTPYVVQWSIAPVTGKGGDVEYWISVQRDVTEQREREERLRRQRNLLEQTQRLAGAWTADVQTGEVSWSDKVYEIFEVPEGEDITTERVLDFHPPEARATLEEAFDRTVENGEPYDLELPLTTEKGNDLWVRAVGSPTEEEDGEVLKVAGAVQNITDRKEAEQALREREARLRGITNSVPGVVYQFYVRPDGDDGCYFVSDRSEPMLGISSDPETFHERFTQGILPSHRQAFLDRIQEAADQELPFRFKMPFQPPDGETLWLLDVSMPERREDEIVFNGVLLDVTERTEAEDKLEWMAKAIDVASDGMALLDETGTYIYMNQAHAEIFGYDSPEAFLGNTWRICYEEAQIEQFEEELLPILREQGFWRGEVPGKQKNGTLFPQHLTLTMLEDGGLICVSRDITERKKEEKRRTQIVERATDAIVEVDSDWQLTLVNDQAEELYGTKEADMLDKNFWDVFEQARGTRFEQKYRGVMESREPEAFEEYYPGLDGWFNIQVYPNEDGGIAFYFTEVTERRKQQKQIERQNDLFAKAQDLASVGGWEYDVKSEEAIWTEEVYRIHGLSPDVEPSPERSLQLYHEEDRPLIEDAFERALREGESYDLELRLITEEGETRWVRTRGEPQVEGGDVVRVRGTIQDITDRRKYEQELERLTELHRLAEEMTSVGGWSVDTTEDWPYTPEWTEKLYDIFDLSPEEPPPFENVFEYYHPEDREAHQEAVRRAEETGEGWEQEIRLITAKGKKRWVRNTGKPVIVNGEMVGIRGAIQDITTQKEREEKLREAKEEAERMNHLKSSFLANMSHEIRTPLTSILGFAEAIGEEIGSTTDPDETDLRTLSEYSELIQKSGHRLMNTLTGVLNLSQLEAGEMTFAPEPLDLSAEVREAVDQFFLQAQEAGINLHVQADSPVGAQVDEGGLQIVLRNLLSNAIKYTEAEGQVKVRAYSEGDLAVLEVEDDGIGMDPETAERLFEAFKQASEGIGRKYEGIGLGLTVTQETLSQMDGTIEINTEEGEGSRFTVRLPKAVGEFD